MAQFKQRPADTSVTARVSAVEQTLQMLATKEDLRAIVAEAVAPLPTRTEMYGSDTALDRRVTRLEAERT